MTLNKKTLGANQELTMLRYLARFGWLTVAMSGELVFFGKSQKDALARRLLNKLAARKEAERHTADGTGIWMVTRKGTKRLADEGNIQLEPLGSKNFGNMRHRAASNWRLINALNGGFPVWTEHEIQCGKAPFVEYRGKVPDGLIVTTEGLIWIEVENAYKSKIEREKIILFCERTLSSDLKTEIAEGCFLFRLEIVSTNKEALSAIYKDLVNSFERGFIRDSEATLVTLSKYELSPNHNLLTEVGGNLWYDLLINE